MGIIKYSDEHKRRISEGMKRNYQSPAFRERQKRRTREAMSTPEVKERLSQASRAAWARRKAAAAEAQSDAAQG